MVALVDDEDYERVAKHKWHVHIVKGRPYASRHIVVRTGVYRQLLLHRFIMKPPKGLQVDHENHNGLDCTRKNLRLCTNTQNNQNKPKDKKNKSGFKGVGWSKQKQKWRVRIAFDGHQKEIGCFDDLLEAARAYDEAAKQYHGEYAYLNFRKP